MFISILYLFLYVYVWNQDILFSTSINLVAFYHECRSLIGYATHYLFAIDSE